MKKIISGIVGVLSLLNEILEEINEEASAENQTDINGEIKESVEDNQGYDIDD